jgi:hypothetical protein
MRTAMAKRARTQHRRDAHRLTHHLKPQSHAHAIGESGLQIARLVRRHQLQRFFRDVALPIRLTAIQHHHIEL